MTVKTDIADLRDEAEAISKNPDGNLRSMYLLDWAADELKHLQGIVDELQAGRTRHDGDCTIYAAMHGRPYDGVCTCGYGWQRVRKNDYSEMYSAQREATEAASETNEPSPPSAGTIGRREWKV